MTRFLNFFTIFVYVSDDYVTFFRFRWIFFNLFINISNLRNWFFYFTFDWIRSFKMSFTINFTYRIITSRYTFVFLTFKLNVLRLFIVLSSVIRRVVV